VPKQSLEQISVVLACDNITGCVVDIFKIHQ
jgi:hypothetical protein